MRKLFAGLVALCLVLMVKGSSQAVTLADYWNGKADFKVDDLDFGKNFGMHFISTCWHANKLYSYYIIDDAGLFSVGLAQSSDGAEFAKVKKVIPVGTNHWDNRIRSFPGVMKDGPTWYLVFEGSGKNTPGDIGLAISSDGINWTADQKPLLVHQSSGWERNNIGTPSLFKEGDTYYLFYHGFGPGSGSSDDCQVGVAYGKDIRKLTRHAANPILPTSKDGWDAGTVGKRSIIKENGYYYMVYEGSTDQPYDKAKWSTGLARATNLLGPWEKCPRNPVLTATASGFGNDGPEWVKTPDGNCHIYFRGTSHTTRRATLVK